MTERQHADRSRSAGQAPPGAWESAVVVRFPSLDRMLAEIRDRFDLPRKPNGIPAHVTLLVPFLPAASLQPRELVDLEAICGRCPRLDVRFASTGRFPRVLYLAPDPAEPFVELTETLTERWPQLRPYAGAHPRIVPHLTLTSATREATLSRVADAVEPLLPRLARAEAAQLYRFDGHRWTEAQSFPFAGHTAPDTSTGGPPHQHR